MNPSQTIDRLVILVVIKSQADLLMNRLQQLKFYFTIIDSTGGLVQEPMVCLLLGFGQARMPELLEIVRQCCKPHLKYVPAQMSLTSEVGSMPMLEAQVGGATLYSMAVEQFIQL
jgi:uncharacterized protein YaaQ